MSELEFSIVHLTEYDVYCLMIKDMNTGKFFKGEEYEKLLEKMNVRMGTLKK